MADNNNILPHNDSSEVLNFALKAAGIGIWDLQLGNEQKIIWDDRCRELFGIAENNSINYEQALSFVHPDDQKIVDQAVKKALTFGSGGSYDVKFRTIGVDDGILRLLKFTGQAYFDEKGIPYRFSGVAMDISAEMKAREERLKLKLLVENSPDLMSIADNDGKVIYLNPAAMQVLGIDPKEEVSALSYQNFYSQTEFDKAQAIYQSLNEKGSWTGILSLRNFETDENIPFNTKLEKVIDPETNKSIGRIGYLRDMRPELNAQRALLENEYKFRNVTNTSPTGLWLSDTEGNLTYLNKTLIDWTGMSYESLLGNGWANAIVEEDRAKGATAFMEAIRCRGHYEIEFRITTATGEIMWCRAAGDPFYDEDGTYAGYAGFCMNIHERVRMVNSIKQNEERIRSIVEQAPMAIGVIRTRDFIIESANDSILKAWRKDATILGLPLIKALPELKGQSFIGLLENVYDTGVPYYSYETLAVLMNLDGVSNNNYFDFVYTPLRNGEGEIDGILILASEVTSRVLAKESLVESEARFRGLIEEAPVATCLFVGKNLVIEIANEEMIRFWGKGNSVLGKPLSEALPELEGQPFFKILANIFVTKEAYHEQESKAELVVDGELKTFYFNFTYKPLLDTNGEVYAIMNMAIDVTSQVINKLRLAENTARLRIAIETANMATWEINPSTNEFIASDRLRNWFGFTKGDEMSFDEMINCIPEKEILTEAIKKAKVKEGNGSLDVEYTAINRKDHHKHILHMVGQTFFNDAGEPYLMTGSAKDITIYRNTQYQLENLIQERTEELQASTEELQASNEELGATNEELAESNENLYRSNEELAQYAYVASHDLQEPLRKIRVFSDILAGQGSLSEENKPFVIKINKAAERMTLLIKDVLEFSKLINSDKVVRTVYLNDAIGEVINDFELVVKEKNAIIKVTTELPVINAVALQMNQLFYNLLNNSLKFIRPEVAPVVEIASRKLSPLEVKQHILRADPETEYYEITVKDNGIGFEVKYSEQIFEVFKRLHGREHYEGSGIGLALCRRIVTNHGGYLYAKSEPGVGSVFHIILPDKK